ncbi:Zinc finger CCHC domain-containing protein 9 [Neolecta irregularis DAH-3]|uniref:Zinc finger CCHC domain-containing protein 9 n=1 Tax=Neolecta irregularis (strain DAH-3) TaxID=1198029 RepID=A0A1U7LTQ7_NEOID|nr:Zinc finger CCHC domain-containing protein 9 [Neolecta irregularis DAH-3]|eukprot:OLL25901.1 Zinc finger CCHC domain-containing protein 9 [Neolecta irregularis DAH-3]
MARITSLKSTKKTYEEASEFKSRPIDKPEKSIHRQHPYKNKNPWSETRRLHRISERAAATHCFVCRAPGHLASECPLASEGQSGICYKCGSTQHALRECKRKVKSLPYAKCFLCKDFGHLTSKCPQNDKGKYPNGGGCGICGGISHLKDQCKKPAEVKLGTTVGMVGNGMAADEDDFHDIVRLDDVKKPNILVKKKKDVRF